MGYRRMQRNNGGADIPIISTRVVLERKGPTIELYVFYSSSTLQSNWYKYITERPFDSFSCIRFVNVIEDAIRSKLELIFRE